MKFKKPKNKSADTSGLAELALKTIHDGVIMTDHTGIINFINPAAIVMTDCGGANNAIGLDYGLVIKLESKEGRELPEAENPLARSMQTNQPLDPCQLSLIGVRSDKRLPVSISVSPVEGLGGNRIIVFRDITKELEEEGEQTEFISTASHEMRTPVATIDGYLSLALNPQTAAIDERARGYLTAAQRASKHLGKLFQDLLDVTKLDDGKIRPRFVPVEMVSLVKDITDDYAVRAKEAGLTFNFGSDEPISLGVNRRMEQVVYGFVDVDFMREILDNLIENAIKYTPDGGSVYVNVRGDGDRVLVNVTDTGLGISADDLAHIFQKFYRADNSDTRTIGGTGLGLYLVKQRVEAMGGKVWAESAFGEGSTFYVSLPRLTSDEYEKRMIAVRNQQMMDRLVAEQHTTQPQPLSQPAQFAQLAQPTSPQPTSPQPAPAATPPVAPTPMPSVPSTPPAPPGPSPTPPAPLVSSTQSPSSPTPPVQPTSSPQPLQSVQPINNNLNGEIK